MKIMNKFLEVFVKGKRKKERFETVCCVENVCSSHSSQRIAFKYYQFDSDRYNILTTDSSFRTDHEKREGHQNKQVCFLPELPESSFGKDCSRVTLEKDYSPEFEERNSTSKKLGLLPERKQKPSEEKSESDRQIYMIRISNSKSFHIGPQNTININSQLSGANGREIAHTSAESKLNLNKVLDCEEKLSENYIALISLHLEKKWKEFGKNLGFKKTFLEDQEVRNGSNGVLIAYDMLHKYLSQFPNTSIGFIIHVLTEIHYTQLIEKLAQELESNRAQLIN